MRGETERHSLLAPFARFFRGFPSLTDAAKGLLKLGSEPDPRRRWS